MKKMTLFACGFPLIVFSVYVLLASSLGWVTFSPDLAAGGLMARHWLHGEYPLYIWGQGYYGTSLLPFMSIAMRVFGSASIISIRAAPAVFSIALVALTVRMIWVIWGRSTAVYAAWILAFPGMFLLNFLVGHTFSHYAVIATFCLMLVFSGNEQSRVAMRHARWLLVGLLSGLGMWASPTFLEYILAITIIVLFQSPEWECLWSFVRRRAGERVVLLGVLLMSGMFLCALLGSVLINNSPHIVHASQRLLSASVVLLLSLVFLLSERKMHVLRSWCAAGLGFAAGSIPLWWSLFFTDHAVDFRMIYFVPTMQDVSVMFHTMLPSLWGIPPLLRAADWGYVSTFQAIIPWMSWALGITCLTTWLWLERESWKSVFHGKKLSMRQAGAVMIFLLFFIPVVSLTMRRPMHEGDVRYILEAWPAWAVIAAITLTSVMRFSRVAAAALLVVFVLPSVFTANRWIGGNVKAEHGIFTPGAMAELEDYLERFDVQGGYAPYSLAYPFNFLMDERFVFTRHERPDIYPPFAQKVNSMDRYALVIELHRSPKALQELSRQERTPEALAAYLQARGVVLMDDVRQQLQHARVLDMHSMLHWDVWILESSSGASL